MSHHAFVFDEASFRKTLRSALFLALDDGEPEDLLAFASARKISGEGKDLTEIAKASLETFYDAEDDIGLGNDVRAARDAFDLAYPEGIAFLTGESLPLRGWYVQSAATVARHLPLVESAANRDALNHDVLDRVAKMLRPALGCGLLVRS